MADVETIVCENCNRAIAAANHTVHVSHCQRHLSVCVECDEPVPRNQLDQHRLSQHRRVECRLCGLEVHSGQMDAHQEEFCSGRAVTCPYCELSMPFSSLQEHESYCGSRTEPCPTCDARVMYKHWPLHVQSGHKLTRPDRPRPPPKVWEDKGTRRPSLREDALRRPLSLADEASLDDKIASYVRKPVDEIVEDTMETWRKRKSLRKFEDDCFEQAMLMAMELSKTSAADTPAETVLCQHCGLSFPAEDIRRHQGSCSWEQRRAAPGGQLPSAPARSALRRPSSGGGRSPSPPRWVARPVDGAPAAEDAVTLPCEFCESAFLDVDLLRHQLRCDKNPHRLDLPPTRAPLRRSAVPPRPPAGPETGAGDTWALRRRSEAGDLTWPRGDPVAADLAAGDRVSRRWSLLEMGDSLPSTPHRKSKHKKKVNFLGQDELIHPEPELVGEVVEGEKKKKKHKKRSSKKHRAPEPPVEPPSALLSCDY